MEQAPQAAQPSEGGGSPADSIKSLVGNISNGLSVLGDVAQSSGMGDGFLKLNEQFQSLVEQMMSGAGQAPEAAPQGGPGMASPEAGAARVRPAMAGSR